MFSTLFDLVTPRRQVRNANSAAPRRAPTKLHVEALEDRFLPAPLFQNVLVSDVGTGNSIAQANTSRNVAAAPNGTIFVAYTGSEGIRIARSTNRGQSFLPSVQLTPASAEVDIAVNSQGVVFASWVESGTAKLSRSINNGATFSTPIDIGAVSSSAMHLAVQSTFVYAVPANGEAGRVLFVNNTSGIGAFTQTTVDTTGRVFADVHANPRTGEVFVISDDPIVRVFRSTNHGQSFTPVALSIPSASIFFNAVTVAWTPTGSFAFISGTGTTAFRINLANGNTRQLTFGNNTDSQGRSLAALPTGRVVDMFFNNGSIKYRLTRDLGATFQPTRTVAAGATSGNVAVTSRDILVAFQRNGRIFLSVFAYEFNLSWYQ